MKKLLTIILSIAAMTFATHALSITIAGINDLTMLDGTGSVSTSNNSFITVGSTSSGPVPANDPTVTEVLTDSGSAAMATYVLSIESGAFLDISFGAPVTGSDELVLFFAGGNTTSGMSINFDLEINGILSNDISPFIPLDTNGMATTITDVDGWTYTLTAAVIDLSLFGLAPDEALDSFRIYLADAGSNFPSLAGAGFVTAIPLPLPLVLLASGLGVLGLFGRRRRL